MSVTNTSASLSTYRKRQLANYGWRLADQYSYNPQTVKAEQAPSHGAQGTGPSNGVKFQAYIGAQLTGQTSGGGACGCVPANTLQGYVKQSPANCGGNF